MASSHETNGRQRAISKGASKLSCTGSLLAEAAAGAVGYAGVGAGTGAEGAVSGGYHLPSEACHQPGPCGESAPSCPLSLMPEMLPRPAVCGARCAPNRVM